MICFSNHSLNGLDVRVIRYTPKKIVRIPGMRGKTSPRIPITTQITPSDKKVKRRSSAFICTFYHTYMPGQFAAGLYPAARASSFEVNQTLFTSLIRCAPEHHGK